jgi:signal transduction histidine kinase
VQRALRATEQSERLIGALLTLARGRAGGDDYEPVNVTEVVSEVRDELAADARARRVTVVLADSSPDGLIALADPTLLDRAVRNLVDNGIRHNVRGGGLWVRTSREHDDIVIEVESTGAVLDAETVALLTEPFYRGAASRTSSAAGGVGLGLAIVDSIATSHGGRLELTPRAEGGLLARLVLPAAD